MDAYLNWLRKLRLQGFLDAKNGWSDQAGSLPGADQRLEYYKGWEDWHENNSLEYSRWTPREEAIAGGERARVKSNDADSDFLS